MENRPTRAGTCCATCDSVLLAAASEARASEREAEQREGGGFGHGSRAYIRLARCPRKLYVRLCAAYDLRF
jgi:hypothetical protein